MDRLKEIKELDRLEKIKELDRLEEIKEIEINDLVVISLVLNFVSLMGYLSNSEKGSIIVSCSDSLEYEIVEFKERLELSKSGVVNFKVGDIRRDLVSILLKSISLLE